MTDIIWLGHTDTGMAYDYGNSIHFQNGQIAYALDCRHQERDQSPRMKSLELEPAT